MGNLCNTVEHNREYKQNGTEENFHIIKQNVRIKSKAANRVLDVCQDADALGMLIIYEDYAQQNQRFDIAQANDYVYIICKKTGKYLTVGSNSEKNGAPIFQQATSSLVGQKFRLANINGNEYYIHTFCGKVLDCNGKQTSNATRVVQADLTREITQIWIIQ